MPAVVYRLFFYKNIARCLLRNFAYNLLKCKADFLCWFPTNLEVFIVFKTNYSYQFCHLIKKCPDYIQSEKRADRKKTNGERTDNIYYISINIVHFLIFADKSWFKVKYLFYFIFWFMSIFKSGFTANEFYETSKSTII